MASLDEIGPVVLEKKCVKFTDRWTDIQTDPWQRWSEKLTWLMWANKTVMKWSKVWKVACLVLLTSHLNGLSPVCDIMCLFRSLGFMHTFLHISQTRFLLFSTTTPFTRNGRLLSRFSLTTPTPCSFSNFLRFLSTSWITDSSTSSPASIFLLRMSGYLAATLLCSIPCTENWWYSSVLLALKALLQTWKNGKNFCVCKSYSPLLVLVVEGKNCNCWIDQHILIVPIKVRQFRWKIYTYRDFFLPLNPVWEK